MICLNSPYTEQVVLPQLKELTENYNMDAFWLDIVFPSPCHCQWCKAKYQQQYKRPLPEDDAALRGFVLQTLTEFLQKSYGLIKSIQPDVLVSYNNAGWTDQRNHGLIIVPLKRTPDGPRSRRFLDGRAVDFQNHAKL